MIKYIMAPFGSWFIMLAWAASFGNIIHYFELKNSMLEEYVITIQVWLFVCIILDIKKWLRSSTG